MKAATSRRAFMLAFAVAGTLLGFAIPLSSADAPKATPATAAAPVTAAATATKPAPHDPRAVTLDFLEKREPEVYKWVKVLQDKDPKRYNDVMNDLICEVNDLIALSRRDPARFEVTLEDRQLAFRALQYATDIRNDVLSPENLRYTKEQLRATVARQFVVRQKLRQLQLDFLQKQLDALQQELNNREQNKDPMIDKRVDDLIKKGTHSEW